MNDRPTISPSPRQIREKRNGRTAAERVLPVRNLRSITTQLPIGLTQKSYGVEFQYRQGCVYLCCHVRQTAPSFIVCGQS
jgi:hypothetical protein